MNTSRHFDIFAYYFCLGNLNTFAWAIIWQLVKAQQNPSLTLILFSVICIIAGIISNTHQNTKRAIAATLTSIAWGIAIVQI
jgi:hypothetical protein